MSVSPYVYRGYSRSSVFSYNPTFVEIYDKFVYEDDIHDATSVGYSLYVPCNIRENIESFHNIGVKNKVELSFYIWAIPLEGVWGSQKFRAKLNLFDNTQENVADNLALSLFLGNNITNLLSYYFDMYFGISFGNKYKISESLDIECFISPTFVWTYFETDYTALGYFSRTMKELEIPMSARFVLGKRTVRQFLTFGISPSILLHYPKAHYDKNVMLMPEDGMYIKKYPISLFGEYGIYFGARRYNVERRNRLNLENGEIK